MNEYQQQLLDHYHSPLNFGKPKFEATHYAKLANLSCGDEVELWLKVNERNIIEDISFSGEGCSIAIGTASLLFSEIKNKPLSYIESLKEEDILNIVGFPLTLTRIKCATLPFTVLLKSLKDNPTK